MQPKRPRFNPVILALALAAVLMIWSVLGTSGIVEPMSQQAILDTIQLEMNQAALRAKNAPGPRRLVLAPGNYGLDYLAAHYPELREIPIVKISNFIGEALDMAAADQFG